MYPISPRVALFYFLLYRLYTVPMDLGALTRLGFYPIKKIEL